MHITYNRLIAFCSSDFTNDYVIPSFSGIHFYVFVLSQGHYNQLLEILWSIFKDTWTDLFAP